MNLEILIIALLFTASIILLFKNFKAGLLSLLGVSLLLHKEIFSIYQWDVLPVRIFMLAFVLFSIVRFILWFLKTRDIKRVKETAFHPFILSLVLLWIARVVSLLNSQNLMASIFMLGFFTTIVFLGIYLFVHFDSKPAEALKTLQTYLYMVFAFVIFASVQFFLNVKYGFIFGALWNVPGHWPRVGALFWDVNHFAGLLAGLLPLAASLALVSQHIKNRLFYTLIFLSTAVILVLTNSRTAWISAFISGLIFVTALLVKKIRMKGILIVALVLSLIAIPAYVEYTDRASPFRAVIKQYFHYRLDSFDSHFYLLRGASEVFDAYPVIGGGYGSFYEHFITTNVADEFVGKDPAALTTRVPAHTIWGEVLAETGYIGTILFIVFLAAGLIPLLYLSFVGKERKTSLVSLGLFSGLTGWLAAGTFYSYNAEFFWIPFILGFVYAIHSLGKGSYERIVSWFLGLRGLGLTIIILLSSILIFANLGKNHLLPWDEAIYAQISKNMVETGEYVVQEWVPGKVWYEKPPLGMWLMAASFNLFGISEFSARIPSALAGIGTIILVYLLAKRMFGKTAAFISSVALLTTFNFLYYSRASMLDVVTAFFITASVYSFWVFRENKKVLPYILTGVFMGLGVMTKGVVGFIPLAVVFLYEFYLLFSGQQKFSLGLIGRVGGIFAISAVVFLPWHLEMYRRFNADFLNNYIGYHVLDRATSAIEDKGRPVFWYLEVIKVSMRIWFVALLPAFVYLISRVYKKDNKSVLLFIWSVFTFALFSAATSKLKWYIVPFYPAASVVISTFLTWFFGFVVEKLKLQNINVLKAVFLLLLTTFSLAYLFKERVLVYESDLTGPQAVLLQTKDEIFGTDTKVYADRIDLPLILFYSDSDYEIVDFGPLDERLAVSDPGDTIVFITKESRFRKLSESYPQLQLVEANKEWVLGFLSDVYNYDSKKREIVSVVSSQ